MVNILKDFNYLEYVAVDCLHKYHWQNDPVEDTSKGGKRLSSFYFNCIVWINDKALRLKIQLVSIPKSPSASNFWIGILTRQEKFYTKRSIIALVFSLKYFREDEVALLETKIVNISRIELWLGIESISLTWLTVYLQNNAGLSPETGLIICSIYTVMQDDFWHSLDKFPMPLVQSEGPALGVVGVFERHRTPHRRRYLYAMVTTRYVNADADLNG